jgi:hypothetical protein
MKTKQFDCVKMSREIKAEINAEMSKMTTRQILDYLQKAKREYNHAVLSVK